jgi:hypothetical protein
VAPSIGTPNIRRLYRSTSDNSRSVFIAMNTKPNIDAPTVCCLSLSSTQLALFDSNRLSHLYAIFVSGVVLSQHDLRQQSNASRPPCLLVVLHLVVPHPLHPVKPISIDLFVLTFIKMWAMGVKDHTILATSSSSSCNSKDFVFVKSRDRVRQNPDMVSKGFQDC